MPSLVSDIPLLVSVAAWSLAADALPPVFLALAFSIPFPVASLVLGFLALVVHMPIFHLSHLALMSPLASLAPTPLSIFS